MRAPPRLHPALLLVGNHVAAHRKCNVPRNEGRRGLIAQHRGDAYDGVPFLLELHLERGLGLHPERDVPAGVLKPHATVMVPNGLKGLIGRAPLQHAEELEASAPLARFHRVTMLDMSCHPRLGQILRLRYAEQLDLPHQHHVAICERVHLRVVQCVVAHGRSSFLFQLYCGGKHPKCLFIRLLCDLLSYLVPAHGYFSTPGGADMLGALDELRSVATPTALMRRVLLSGSSGPW